MELTLLNLLINTPNHIKRHFILPEMTLQKDFIRIRKKVLFYRFTFVFLGILFAYLSAILYFHNPNWILHHVFFKGILIKNSLVVLSFALSISALWFGCHTRTSIEVAKSYTSEAILRIKSAYSEMQSQLSYHNYQLALIEIKRNYKETLYHLDRIHGLPSLSDSEKLKIKMTHLKNLKDKLDEARILTN